VASLNVEKKMAPQLPQLPYDAKKMKTARSKEQNKYWREENILKRILRLEREREGEERPNRDRRDKRDNPLRERERERDKQKRRAKEKSE
jgi:hypothetical protein